MFGIKEKYALKSVRNNFLLASIIIILVIIVLLVLNKTIFKQTFATLEEVTKPNQKLRVVSILFQKVNLLEQNKRINIFQNKEIDLFIYESAELISLIDSLNNYYTEDSIQTNRLKLMKASLIERDKLLLNYLKIHGDFINNKYLKENINDLSEYISENIKKADSNVVRSHKKTTTIIFTEGKKDSISQKQTSFFKRLFSKKKNTEPNLVKPTKTVTEDLTITIDTIAIAQKDSFINELDLVIKNIENNYNRKNKKFINNELQLANANQTFINELQILVQQIQNEELFKIQEQTNKLKKVFDDASTILQVTFTIFILLISSLIYLILLKIRESDKNQTELVIAKEKAVEMEKIKERFLANMSHEIRTPLQSIIGYSEQIMSQEKPKKEEIEAIYKSSDHLLNIINEILDYSKISSNNYTLNCEAFNMADVISEISINIKKQSQKKNINYILNFNFSSNDYFMGDSFRLKQILYNILGNAIKFTNQGFVEFTIKSIPKNKKTEFIFEIKDSGIGMSDREISTIFNEFEQANTSIQNNFGGSGLGLTISKKLIELQNGKIKVNSEKNRGSVFTISITYLNSNKKNEGKNDLQNEISYQGKVVLIDDDKLILNLCSIILTKYSITHLSINNPHQALTLNIENNVSMIIMDIRMPEINGIDLCKILKSKINHDVRFVALTAEVLPDEHKKILTSGFDEILLKPFKEKDFLRLFVNKKINLPTLKIDFRSIEEMCNHNPIFIKETLELIIIETQKDLDCFDKAFELKNKDGLISITHKLSGKIGQLGVNTILNQLRELETELKLEKEFVLPPSKQLNISKSINELIISIKNHLNNLNN